MSAASLPPPVHLSQSRPPIALKPPSLTPFPPSPINGNSQGQGQPPSQAAPQSHSQHAHASGSYSHSVHSAGSGVIPAPSQSQPHAMQYTPGQYANYPANSAAPQPPSVSNSNRRYPAPANGGIHPSPSHAPSSYLLAAGSQSMALNPNQNSHSYPSSGAVVHPNAHSSGLGFPPSAGPANPYTNSQRSAPTGPPVGAPSSSAAPLPSGAPYVRPSVPHQSSSAGRYVAPQMSYLQSQNPSSHPPLPLGSAPHPSAAVPLAVSASVPASLPVPFAPSEPTRIPTDLLQLEYYAPGFTPLHSSTLSAAVAVLHHWALPPLLPGTLQYLSVLLRSCLSSILHEWIKLHPDALYSTNTAVHCLALLQSYKSCFACESSRVDCFIRWVELKTAAQPKSIGGDFLDELEALCEEAERKAQHRNNDKASDMNDSAQASTRSSSASVSAAVSPLLRPFLDVSTMFGTRGALSDSFSLWFNAVLAPPSLASLPPFAIDVLKFIFWDRTATILHRAKELKHLSESRAIVRRLEAGENVKCEELIGNEAKSSASALSVGLLPSHLNQAEKSLKLHQFGVANGVWKDCAADKVSRFAQSAREIMKRDVENEEGKRKSGASEAHRDKRRKLAQAAIEAIKGSITHPNGIVKLIGMQR